eukprot:jgi/Botrbrau1/7406/Bobra.0112s0007.2
MSFVAGYKLAIHPSPVVRRTHGGKSFEQTGKWAMAGQQASRNRKKHQVSAQVTEETMTGLHTGQKNGGQAARGEKPANAFEKSLPSTYKKLIAKRAGSSFREAATVEEEVLNMPGEGKVLIKVLYTGINGGCETFRVRGEPYTPFARNAQAKDFALGAEGAGVVVAVGPGVEFPTVGQHVTTSGANTFAEYVIAAAESCWPIKEATPEAVAITLSGVTAAVALEVTGGPMRETDTVLVTAAAGGTGHFAVQLAKLAGCHVVATCGGKEKAAALKELGADRVIDYKSEEVAEVLDREYGGRITVAYEGVGGSLRQAILPHLAAGGRMLAVGYISGYPHNAAFRPPSARDPDSDSDPEPLPPDHLLMWEGRTIQHKGATIYGNTWGGASPKQVKEARQRLFRLHEEGRLKVLIDRSHEFKGIESIPDAIDYMLSGDSIGKVVAQL